jgi:RsiW-degrading membrane proteinase PrsW (M82 family)
MQGMETECPSCHAQIVIPQREGESSLLNKTPPPPSPEEPIAYSPPPAFYIKRMVPMIVYCLGFGWLLSYLLPARYFVEAPIIPIAILATASLVLALLTSAYFISPVEFPRKQALSSLFFTMIIGMSLLLAFQKLTIAMSDHKFQGPPKIRLFMGVFQLIGEAYKSIHSESIIGQFFGFIFGVGLCEEFTKLLPLFIISFWTCSDVKLGYRKFLMVGFFSGLGFGISEALFFYAPWGGNFSTNSNIIRWFACVPFHAIYTVIDAACLWYLVPKLRKTKGDSIFYTLGFCASATFAVAVIHGVYDVLFHIPHIGLVLDGASMALMFWLVNKVARKRRQGNMVGHSEGAGQRGVMSFVRRCETDGWKFALVFMLAGFMILLSLKFSISIRTGGVYLRIFKNAGNYEIKNGGAWGAYCLELKEDRSAHFMFYSGEDNHPTAIIRSFRARSGPNVYSGNYALGGEEQQTYLLEGEKLHHLTATLRGPERPYMILTGRSQGDTLTLRFISPADEIGGPFSPSNWDSNKLEIHGFEFKFYSE